MNIYLALITKDPGSDFGVTFPDFPGCVTAGRTITEAKEMAVEALAGHISLMKEDGDSLPVPSSPEDIFKEAENYGALVFEVNPGLYNPTKRVNVTLPVSILEDIARQKKNRSAFLAEAAREKLQRKA